ncbi:MAG: Na(+)-translocating NADH-quinone reductase subunit F [Lutibacter sp.]|nr:MAG: Na(+)-translocating NADH-quinone reductase subunit F [Lutibacter sp.]
MKLPPRLEQAITKLYIAFQHGTLHPECCKNCAVGTICDHMDTWNYLTTTHGSLNLSYIGRLNENFGRKIHGYSPTELLQIEIVFLKGCGYSVPLVSGYKRPENPTNKDLLFKGLCDTVEFLCKLDAIPNVMDYSKLFEFENNMPIGDLHPIRN